MVHVAGGSPPYNIAVVHISPAVAIRRLFGGHDNALRWSSEYESSGHTTRNSTSAPGSTCVTLPLGQVLRGRSGSEVTTTSPTLGDVLLPRSPAGFKGAAGTHVPIIRQIGDTGGTSFQLIDHACDSLPKTLNALSPNSRLGSVVTTYYYRLAYTYTY